MRIHFSFDAPGKGFQHSIEGVRCRTAFSHNPGSVPNTKQLRYRLKADFANLGRYASSSRLQEILQDIWMF